MYKIIITYPSGLQQVVTPAEGFAFDRRTGGRISPAILQKIAIETGKAIAASRGCDNPKVEFIKL